jgi:predicted O-linked N-acetylglucosamine transferase (SPINDLY family)
MTILRSTPGSVLWFLSPPEETIGRLKEMAGAAGVAADRLIFAGRLHNPDHMARFGLADVFLDTSPYGAHTTASDALWMGVPVLTVPGRGFASRVCGSLVQAVDWRVDLQDVDEYVARAIEMVGIGLKLITIRINLVKIATSVFCSTRETLFSIWSLFMSRCGWTILRGNFQFRI